MFICLALSDIEKLYILHLFLYQKFSDVRQRTDECTLIKMQGAIIFFVYKSRTFNSFLLYWIWQKQIRTLLRWKQVARMCIHTSYFVLCTWHKKKSEEMLQFYFYFHFYFHRFSLSLYRIWNMKYRNFQNAKMRNQNKQI